MMSLETIEEVTRNANRKASAKNLTPYMIWPEDLIAWREGRGFPMPFPMIGDYEPKGWKAVGEPLFVDTSGFGEPGELSLTLPQLLDELKQGRGYAFIEQGQFQSYLQPFEKLP